MLSTIDYLDVERVPPLSRRSFKQLLDGWALSPEAWCDHVLLGAPLPKASPPKPAPRSTMPEVKALQPTPATMPTRKPGSIHGPDAPLKDRNIAG